MRRREFISLLGGTALAWPGKRVDALLVAFDGLFQANIRMIANLAERNRLPAIYVGREFIEAGGLMTYGVSFPHLYSPPRPTPTRFSRVRRPRSYRSSSRQSSS